MVKMAEQVRRRYAQAKEDRVDRSSPVKARKFSSGLLVIFVLVVAAVFFVRNWLNAPAA